MSFKDNVNTIDTPLYKRIRQNAARYPTDEEILDQYKVYLAQKLKQVEYLNDVYKMNKSKNTELNIIKSKLNKVKNAKLAQWVTNNILILLLNIQSKILFSNFYFKESI